MITEDKGVVLAFSGVLNRVLGYSQRGFFDFRHGNNMAIGGRQCVFVGAI